MRDGRRSDVGTTSLDAVLTLIPLQTCRLVISNTWKKILTRDASVLWLILMVWGLCSDLIWCCLNWEFQEQFCRTRLVLGLYSRDSNVQPFPANVRVFFKKSLWEWINKRKAPRFCRCSIRTFTHFSPTPLRWRHLHLLITHILGYNSERGAKTRG